MCALRLEDFPGEQWDLGHDDPHRVAVNGGALGRRPEHRRCNRATVLHSRPVTVAPKEIPEDDPEHGMFFGPDGQRWSRVWLEWR